MCLCMYVCMYVCMYLCINIHTYIYGLANQNSYTIYSKYNSLFICEVMHLACHQSKPRFWCLLWTAARWSEGLRLAACPRWLTLQAAAHTHSDTQSTCNSNTKSSIYVRSLSEKSHVSYQQVLLYLLVQLVQFALPVVQQGAGLMVALFPIIKIPLIQILVGQHQSPQTLPCKLL